MKSDVIAEFAALAARMKDLCSGNDDCSGCGLLGECAWRSPKEWAINPAVAQWRDVEPGEALEIFLEYWSGRNSGCAGVNPLQFKSKEETVWLPVMHGYTGWSTSRRQYRVRADFILIKDEIKLLPCPFCGNKAVELRDNVEDHRKNEMVPQYVVNCSFVDDDHGCGASSGWGQTRREAVDAWNRRAEVAR